MDGMKDGKGEKKGQVIERQTASLADVFDAMGRGVTVVSGNKRLAAVTLRAFEQAALERGLEAWPTPRIWHWPVWLHNGWEEAVISGSVSGPAFLLTPSRSGAYGKISSPRAWPDNPCNRCPAWCTRCRKPGN